MFDNLRDDASSLNEEDDTVLFPDEEVESFGNISSPQRVNGKILGMTGMQRFIIASMLLVAVFTLGAMCLLITGKISLI